MNPGPCAPGKRHHFDPISGWCHHPRCGWRDDGQSEYNYRPDHRPVTTAPDITEPRRKATP